MIETTMSEDRILSLPVMEAVEMMVTMAWFMRLASNPDFRLADARNLTLREVLSAVDVVQRG